MAHTATGNSRSLHNHSMACDCAVQRDDVELVMEWLRRVGREDSLREGRETAEMLVRVAALSIGCINLYDCVLRHTLHHHAVAHAVADAVVRALRARARSFASYRKAVKIVTHSPWLACSEVIVARVLPHALLLEEWRTAAAGTRPASLDALGTSADAPMAYDGALLRASLHYACHSKACDDMIRTTLRLLLPRFFEALPAETDALCVEHMQLYWQPQLFDALCEHRPALLTLQGAEPGDSVVRSMYPEKAKLRPASDPRMVASLLYENRLHSIECRGVHGGEDDAWWAALCAHLLQLVGARARCLEVDAHRWLNERLSYGGRFVEGVRLCVRGVVTLDNGVPLVAPCYDRNVYSASCVAEALSTGGLSPPDWKRMSAYRQHLRWLRLDVLLSAHLRCMPRWTPETHAALYSHSGLIHQRIYVLFLAHELRSQSLLASLPYELLFQIFDAVSCVEC